VRSVDAKLRARELGVTPICGDLDDARSLYAVSALSENILYLAPPPTVGELDTRIANFFAALKKTRRIPQRLVYVSTSGVYGDCDGGFVSETRKINPQTPRARRRCHAESLVRRFFEAYRMRGAVLRAPGIYSSDRLPLERLKKNIPVLNSDDDSFSNHIHADDLAKITLLALYRSRAGRIFNASDGLSTRIGDYYDLLADRARLPRPPRVSLADAKGNIPELSLSFMVESRRLLSDRMKREMRIRLRYPSVYEGIPKLVGVGD